jgi:hypothetical protein
MLRVLFDIVRSGRCLAKFVVGTGGADVAEKRRPKKTRLI